MRQIRDKNEDKNTVVASLKSSSDDRLVDFNMKIPQYRKREIQDQIKKINTEERPVSKVTQVGYIMKAVKLLEKRLEKARFEDI